jgi:hypothetical protein
LSEKFIIIKRIQQDIIINVQGLQVKQPSLLSDFNKTWIFLTDFENPQISEFLKIRPVGAKLFHADGQTNITKLTAAFPYKVK